jgi:ubiquinone/menaquinone biosynthesis C-methylase UbiE
MGAAVDPDAFNAFEATGWEQQASGYDAFFGPITTRLVGPLLDAAGVRRGARVLDVATGPGYVAAAAAERGADVVGVDVAGAMLALARRAHPGLDFRTGDAEALPLPDASFDMVVANFALLHLGRPEQAAREFARVLVPGGRVALTVWDLPERARFIGVLLEAVASATGGAPPDIPVGPPFFRFSEEAEFTRLLADAGLEEIRIDTVAFSLHAASADALWQGVLGGTVRSAALIVRQPEATQRAIRAAFDGILQAYTGPDGLELAVSVKLASAATPRT